VLPKRDHGPLTGDTSVLSAHKQGPAHAPDYSMSLADMTDNASIVANENPPLTIQQSSNKALMQKAARSKVVVQHWNGSGQPDGSSTAVTPEAAQTSCGSFCKYLTPDRQR